MRKPKTHPDAELAEIRRCQVLDAAAECFRQKGYHRASMVDIARASGMSQGHIYNYFVNKEAIIEAFVERDKERLFAILQRLRETPGPLIDALIAGIPHGVDQNLDAGRGSLMLEMMAEAARNPKVASLLRSSDSKARERMRNMLTGPNGSHQGKSDQEVDGCIEMIFALFNGILIRALMNPDLDREALVSALQPVLRTILTVQDS